MPGLGLLPVFRVLGWVGGWAHRVIYLGARVTGFWSCVYMMLRSFPCRSYSVLQWRFIEPLIPGTNSVHRADLPIWWTYPIPLPPAAVRGAGIGPEGFFQACPAARFRVLR